MNLSALEISKKLKGSVFGDDKVIIQSLSRIEDAEKGSISFIAHEKYLPFLKKTKASAVLISKNIEISEYESTTVIRVHDAYNSFAQLLIEWSNEKTKDKKEGIHPTAIIDPSVQIGAKVFIGPYVFIGSNTKIEDGVQIQSHCYLGNKVEIKKNTILNPRVSILDNSEIGSECILHPGVVIGSDGFGFVPQKRQA